MEHLSGMIEHDSILHSDNGLKCSHAIQNQTASFYWHQEKLRSVIVCMVTARQIFCVLVQVTFPPVSFKWVCLPSPLRVTTTTVIGQRSRYPLPPRSITSLYATSKNWIQSISWYEMPTKHSSITTHLYDVRRYEVMKISYRIEIVMVLLISWSWCQSICHWLTLPLRII